MMGITVFVTGASGLVGRYVLSELLKKTNNKVVAISSSPFLVYQRHQSKRLRSIGYEDFLAEPLVDDDSKNWKRYLIHCAFTRRNDFWEVKKGIDLAKDVFIKCCDLDVNGVLNISSRSVYKEPEEGSLNTEVSELNVAGPITLGKYTIELFADAILGRAGIPYSNLRLSSVNELKTDNNMVRPLNVFVENVVAGKPIQVVGGMQVMSFIDPRDVASAIISLLVLPTDHWKSVYNIGTGWMCTDTLINMAHLVVERGTVFGFPPVEIIVENKEVSQRAGLDITRISEDTGWVPKISLTEMVDALFAMKLESNNNK